MKELSPSQISDFLFQIENLKYVIEDEPSISAADKLNKFENKLILDEIEFRLIENKDGDLSLQICAILAQRWERIRSSSMSYTESPFNPINQFCLELAKTIYPVPETEIEIDKLPEREGPYFILMPSLKASADVAGTNIHNLLLQQFILSDNDEIYIPIESILDRAATSDDGEYQHYVSQDGDFPKLSADELKRLKNHSTIINDYILAIEQLNDLRIRGSGLGAKLLSLVNALRAGGSHQGQNFEEARRLGLDPHENAGSKANIGIMEFGEYWEKVPEDTKREYLRKYPGLIEPIDRLFHPNDVKYRNAILCVELIADAIETVITSNRLSTQSVEQFERLVAAKKAIFLREIKSYNYIFLPSLAKSPKIYADIFKLPIDKQKLIFPGYENLCIYLLANDPLALIEFKDLISEEIRQEICIKKYSGNNTPLMAAVNYGSIQLVNLLLEMRVNIDDVNSAGETALMQAVRANNKDLVLFLLEKGARIDIVNIDGLNPLTLAAEKNHKEILEIILLKTLSLDKATQIRLLPLSYNSVLAYVLDKHLPSLPLILGKIIELKDKDILYMTYKLRISSITYTVNALMLAAFYNKLDLMQKLVDDLGADIDDMPEPSNNYTALMFAAEHGKIDAVNKLLSMGANIESSIKYNDTALILAVKSRHRAIVELLLEKGASLLPRNIYNSLDYALMYVPELVDIFLLKAMSLSADDQKELLRNFSNGDYKSIFDYILNNRRHLILPFLEDAISKNNRKILDSKVDVNSINMLKVDFNSINMLMVAIKHGNNNLVSRLIDESHLDIDEVDNLGNTALIYAVNNRNMDIFNNLLSRNANLTARNSLQQNILDIALNYYRQPHGSIYHYDFYAANFDNAVLDNILLKAAFLSLEDQQNLLSRINGGAYKSILSYAAATRPNTLIPIFNKALDLKQHDIFGQKIKLNAMSEKQLIPYIISNDNINSASSLALILRLIDTGIVELDAQDNNGKTLLHYAVEFGRKDLVSKLLDINANIELKSSLGDTPLISAVKFDRVEIFNTLLAKNPKLITTNNDEKNVFDIAHSKYNNQSYVDSILFQAVNLSKAEQTELLSKIDNGKHKTVLSYAARYRTELFVSLLNKTIDLNKKDVLGEKIFSSLTSEMHLISYIIEILSVNYRYTENAVSLISRLIDEGIVDIDEKDNYDNTILHNAIACARNSIVTILLEKNANIELKSSLGNTALMTAVIHDNIKAFNAIFEKKPILTTRNIEQKNALDIAHEHDYTSAFLDSLLLQAAFLSLDEQTELLSKIDGGKYKTVLAYAAEYRPNLVENLLNQTIDLKRQDILDAKVSLSETYSLPLLSFIMQKTKDLSPSLVLRLIDEGLVDINQQDISDGNTLLHNAVISGKTALVSSLLSKKPNLDLKNSLGNNALILALKEGYLDIFNIIIARNSSLIIRDNQRNNLLDIVHVNYNSIFIEPILLRASTLSLADQTELLSKIDNGRHKTVLSYAASYRPSLVASLLTKTIIYKNKDVLDKKISLSPTRELSLLPYLIENMGEVLTYSLLNGLIKEHLIDIHQKYNDGKNIFQLAIDANDINIIRNLINNADHEMVDCDNNTALYYAINKRNHKMVRVLLENRADLTARNLFGENALDLAIKNNFAVDDVLLAGARLEPAKQRELLARQGDFNDVLSYALLKRPNLVMPIFIKKPLTTNRLDRYIKQTKLLDHIEIIKAKWQEMDAKAQLNPRYIKAAKAAEKLTKDLINETALLMQMDPYAVGYDKKITQFKTNCLSHIKTAKTVLDVHRCDLWKKILGALILALTAPISLTMCALGLFSLKTDSAKKLDSLEHDLRPAMVF